MIYISVFLFNTSVTFPCKKGQTLLDVKKHFLLKSIHKSSGEKHLKIQYTNGFKDNLYVKPFNIDLSIILLKMQLECFVLCLTLITPLTHSLKQSWCQKLWFKFIIKVSSTLENVNLSTSLSQTSLNLDQKLWSLRHVHNSISFLFPEFLFMLNKSLFLQL